MFNFWFENSVYSVGGSDRPHTHRIQYQFISSFLDNVITRGGKAEMINCHYWHSLFARPAILPLIFALFRYPCNIHAKKKQPTSSRSKYRFPFAWIFCGRFLRAFWTARNSILRGEYFQRKLIIEFKLKI